MEQDKKSENQINEPYLYRWDYREQQTYDTGCAKQKKKRGIVTYAVVMALFFAACIALLAVTVLWLDGSGGASRREDQALTTEEIAERLNPTVVLIYVADNLEYGSGFFIRSDGYIATNAHFVAGCENIFVTLYSGEEYKARLVGYSVADDLAVLKIEGKNFPTVTVGNSSAVRVGETAIAIGNPSGPDAAWSTTQGIISAVERTVLVPDSYSITELTMIQTDAPVNHGNSGGPLCNDKGEVIGIVTRKLTGYESLGLALPVNGCMELLNAIIETGTAKGIVSAVSRVRPTVGITGVTVEKGTQYSYAGKTHTASCNGVLVSAVTDGGAADGILQVTDIIIAIDGTELTEMEQLIELLYNYEVGDRVHLTVARGGESLDVEMILGKIQ